MGKKIKYRIMDIVCVKYDYEIIPYVFNNNKTKLKNLFNNEIIDCNFTEFKYWRDCEIELRDFFNKFYNGCSIINLYTAVKFGATNPLYRFIRQKTLDNIEYGTDYHPTPKEDCFIDRKKIMPLIIISNAELDNERKILLKEKKKTQKSKQEAENSHEF